MYYIHELVVKVRQVDSVAQLIRALHRIRRLHFLQLLLVWGKVPLTSFGGPDYKLLLSTDLCCTDRVNILQGIKFQKPSGFYFLVGYQPFMLICIRLLLN
jgi:hypothetical protein